MGGHSEDAESGQQPRVARGAVFGSSVLSWLGIFIVAPAMIGRRGRHFVAGAGVRLYPTGLVSLLSAVVQPVSVGASLFTTNRARRWR